MLKLCVWPDELLFQFLLCVPGTVRSLAASWKNIIVSFSKERRTPDFFIQIIWVWSDVKLFSDGRTLEKLTWIKSWLFTLHCQRQVYGWRSCQTAHMFKTLINAVEMLGNQWLGTTLAVFLFSFLISDDLSKWLKHVWLCFISGPVYSTEHVWISQEEQNCWFGIMIPTPPSSASRFSASLRMKTVREHLSFTSVENVVVNLHIC